MKAGDVMTIGAATVRPDATIAHAAKVMIEHGVSGLPVVDAHKKVIGIVTERDLLRRHEIGTEHRRPRWMEFLLEDARLATEYAHERGHKVSDVMSRAVVTVDAEMPLDQVVDLLEKREIKRVPVVRDGEVIGIISRSNLVRALASHLDGPPQSAASDLKIRDAILREIRNAAWGGENTFDVVVDKGVVTLNGTVRDSHIGDAMRVAAENVHGVIRVENNLRVFRLPGTGT